ncbi:DUF2490 domain-containing protein [Rufibacter sediminis]|uniref:DUF2490 domain-containing protein n=1 Tax=Rufibacter sediminis TaxID=2762756 RepID=A0ABR6VRS7_9BACT|nr:DUF2490 domain-containing protein [Rufibacter sediminis]MBC3539625.1 DUF2490 domain-containing protein [Rufibacter sediminis]
MKIKLKSLLFVLSLLVGLWLTSRAQAQPNRLNHWVQYQGSYWFNPQWSVTTNLQYRTYKPFKDPRVGFAGAEGQYTFKDAPISLGAGYAHLFNRNYTGPEETNLTHENRIYQQITVRGNLWKARLSHRYQLEERWLPQGYHTRFRYLLSLRVPLGPKEQEVRPWYGILRNEIRVIVRDQPFDSNRVFGGVGYTFNKHLALEGMWMSQLAGGGNHQHFTMFVLRHDFGRMEE